MVDFIIIVVLAAIIGSVIWYIRSEKRKGIQCVGCPDSKTCAGNCSGCSGCGGNCQGTK